METYTLTEEYKELLTDQLFELIEPLVETTQTFFNEHRDKAFNNYLDVDDIELHSSMQCSITALDSLYMEWSPFGGTSPNDELDLDALICIPRKNNLPASVLDSADVRDMRIDLANALRDKLKELKSSVPDNIFFEHRRPHIGIDYWHKFHPEASPSSIILSTEWVVFNVAVYTKVPDSGFIKIK